tara:strand:- start:400 stop:606 length:207 start_codon:yes stop_codon:yes gene_type:complete
MKFLLIFPTSLSFLFPTKIFASRSYQVKSVCENFAAGKIDALKTMEALNLNINNYSIGVNNTAKIFFS